MSHENDDVDGTEDDAIMLEEVETTVVIEHRNPHGPGSGVSSGALIGISETGAPTESTSTGLLPGSGTVEPTPTEPTTPSGGSSGGEAAEAAVPLGEETKKHAACDSAHSTDPGSVGWQGPTRKGPDAQSLAQADADEHNRKNAGHQASVLDGEGRDPHP